MSKNSTKLISAQRCSGLPNKKGCAGKGVKPAGVPYCPICTNLLGK